MAEEIKTEVTIEENVEQKVEKQDADLQKAQADYKADMFKFKERMKAAEEENKKLKEDQDSRERAGLEKNEEWKTLYENEKLAKAEAVSELQDKSSKFIDSSKVNAVLQNVGGFKKDSYSKFIEAKNVEMNEDGTINSDSLAKEVDRIKQNYPELLKASTQAKLPDGAPFNFDPNSADKQLGQMSKSELKAAFSAKKQ